MKRLLAIALLAATLSASFYAGHYTREEKPAKPYVVFPEPLFEQYAVPIPTKDAVFVTCPADCNVSGFSIDNPQQMKLGSLVVVSRYGNVKVDHFDITVAGSPWLTSYGMLMLDSRILTGVRKTSAWWRDGK